MTSIRMKDQEFQEYFAKTMQDPYIQKCVGHPEVPVYFVKILEELMEEDTTTPKSQIYMWSTAAILLQMSLEMHTKVTVESTTDTIALQSRQRYVLAGDYYSSLFYRLLAVNHEYGGLRHFSQAISQVNQEKLSLHMKWIKQRSYDDEMIKNLKRVTSGLLVAVADFFHVQTDFLSKWKKVAEIGLFVDYLERHQTWHHFSDQICHDIRQTWDQMLLQFGHKNAQQGEQRLLLLLDQKSIFVNRLSVKES